MTTNEFISTFRHVMSEFRYLNEHFDEKDSSKITDYNTVFENWKRDMYRIRRNLIFDMHWATSSQFIAKNEILFDVRFQGKYLCEIKYRFDPKFVKTFAINIETALEVFTSIANEFDKIIETIDVHGKAQDDEKDPAFQNWKKRIYASHEGIAVDVHWKNMNEPVLGNTLYLSMMYRDDCLFEVNYVIQDESRPVNMDDDPILI
jgi:hypothetical protein